MRRTLLVGLVMLGCGAEGPSGPMGGDAGGDTNSAALDAPYNDTIGGRVCSASDDRVDCDGDPSNGCEARVLTDPNNCQRCGHRCTGDTPVCRVGACTTGG